MIAHIKQTPVRFEIQTLDDHLIGTAMLAKSFGQEFSNPYWGWVLGLYHDLGKYSKDFQEYIKVNSGYEEDDQKKSKTDHTSAGAILVKETLPNFFWQPIAYCIAG
ncbi:MAG: CRISPR-associated endonuclease Cas3'', partial [Bacteroidia bacterium]|nr:CRISPR-associated endonuclease Cas3'' [Bacteroidia bacterium]